MAYGCMKVPVYWFALEYLCVDFWFTILARTPAYAAGLSRIPNPESWIVDSGFWIRDLGWQRMN